MKTKKSDDFKIWINALLIMIAFSSTACNQVAMSSNKDMLGKSVFNAAGTSADVPTFNGPPSDGTALGEINQRGSVSVEYQCYGHSTEQGANLKPALTNATTPVSVSVDGQNCSSDSSAIKAQLQAHQLNLMALCPGLVTGHIALLKLSVNNQENTSVGGEVGNPSNPMDQRKFMFPSGPLLEVLYASNENNGSSVAADDNCQQRVDPLIVHVGKAATDEDVLSLTSPEKGVMFDMLGARNGHKKIRISWFTTTSYGLLALPDRNGRVNSIDQLFGDATTGPDGKTSENGYAALAKYDDNHDGRIDERDAVFAKLRVWIDRDHNGVASSRELITLDEAGISYILLDYTKSFSETDKYGNIADSKSFIGRTDGTQDLIFDLWFAFGGH